MHLLVQLGLALVGSLSLANDHALARNRDQGAEMRRLDAAVTQYKERYRQRLGHEHDPFALKFTPAEVAQTFHQLAFSSPEGTEHPRPLGKLNRALRSDVVSGAPFERALLNEVLRAARRGLHDPHSPTELLQSHYLALGYAVDYLRVHAAPEPPKSSRSDARSNQRQSRGNQPPPDRMQAQNKPMPQQDGGKPRTTAETNVDSKYFAMAEFSQIVRNKSGLFFYPSQRRQAPATPPAFRPTEATLSLFPEPGERMMHLALPPGYRPLQPAALNAELRVGSTGGYELHTKSDATRVDIPLVPEGSQRLAEHELAEFTQPVAISMDEWPEKVRKGVFDRVKRDSATPLEIAAIVKHHLEHDYRYFKGEGEETDLIRALQKGELQCDLAAGAMASILRNIYSVPTRIRAGYGAARVSGKASLTTGALPHAWVEVFHEGKWHAFDPQPEKAQHPPDGKPQGADEDAQDSAGEGGHDGVSKQPQDHGDRNHGASSQQGAASGHEPKQGATPSSSGRAEPQSATQPASSREEGRSPGSHAAASETKPGSGAGRWARGLMSRIRQSLGGGRKDEARAEQDNARPLEDPKQEPAPAQDPFAQLDASGHSKERSPIELGQLSLKSARHGNPLLKQALRTVLRASLEPIESSEVIQAGLHRAQSLLSRYPFPELAKLLSSAMSAHAIKHAGLEKRLMELERGPERLELSDAYAELVATRRSVELYAAAAEGTPGAKVAEGIVADLRDAQAELDRVAHPQGRQVAAVRDLVKRLPPLAQRLLTSDREFDLSRVGPNAETMKIARSLGQDQLGDFRLIGSLRSHADFVLASTPQPDTSRSKTWLDSQRRGRDLLPLRRLSDLPRALVLQPGKSRLDNFEEGTAFQRTRRKQGVEVVGKQNESAQRVTIVLVDQSGSTKQVERFIRTLTATFSANALSDVGPSGVPRHKVIILPYGDTVHAEIPVTSVNQALDLIQNRNIVLRARNEGTQTQEGLLAALRRIKRAQDESAEPLALANIVVVTDGECTINEAELKVEREKIHRKTPIQTMFVAIKGENAELARFANDSQAAGIKRGFYRHFSGEEITRLEREADHFDAEQLVDEGRAFYAERSAWSRVSPDFFQRLRRARAGAARLEQEVLVDRQATDAEPFLQQLRRPSGLGSHEQSEGQTAGAWAEEVRGLLKDTIAFGNTALIRRVAGDVLSNFGELTGHKLTALGPHAKRELEALIDDSKRPSAGSERQ